MIILGDAGMNFYGGLRDRFKKEWLSQLPLTIFSIHGNHEMRPDTIASYHTTEWRGGTIYVEDDFPNLLFAMDGEIYDMDGIKAIAIGGAYSIDKAYRLAHGYGWWPDEQPSPAIKERVESTLDKNGWQVDVVLSHTTPLKYEPVEAFLSRIQDRPAGAAPSPDRLRSLQGSGHGGSLEGKAGRKKGRGKGCRRQLLPCD